jgi:Fe-S-cluster-containing dehydrogenase component
MGLDRRAFLRASSTLGLGVAAGALSRADDAPAGERSPQPRVGCLVDTTLCIGCRQCEAACNRRNELPRPDRPFDDPTVLRDRRRPSAHAYTVVNEYDGSPSRDQHHRSTTHVKTQCMHCLDPSCVSACIVGALTKARDGAVVYDPEICIGCRYCMVACPFGVPAYEYDDALAPRVRKCEFCARPEAGRGAAPACAAACPTEALVFGERDGLLDLARERVSRAPVRYRDQIYGESEVGGTAWLYLLGRAPDELDLIALPDEAPPRVTEAIQHTIFRYGAIPLVAYGGLFAILWRNRRRHEEDER